ncbi:hypothetical protein HFD88_002521 [Aspergillus terreus]|nr:hypothetical protein HFD88_002521 [Aspergillus terreus]
MVSKLPYAVIIPTGGPPKVVGPKTKTIARPTNKLLRYVDETAAFAWNYDSLPFVCVTMLSDCTGMVGGETALKTATGEIMKVRGPAMGTAVVMQGRYIEHRAPKALGVYTQYRLEILEERIRARLKKEQRREIAKRPFDTPDTRAFDGTEGVSRGHVGGFVLSVTEAPPIYSLS